MREPLYDDVKFNNVGSNIQYFRKAKGLTQAQLAELTNLSLSHIQNIESKKSESIPSLVALYKISIILEIPIDCFLKDDGIQIYQNYINFSLLSKINEIDNSKNQLLTSMLYKIHELLDLIDNDVSSTDE